MDIRTALSRLIAIQGALTITSPISASVKKAYTYVPPQSAAAPDCPCFLNSWTFLEELRAGGLRELRYSVRMQLLVEDADQDRASDIASAFHVALVDALDADTQLKIAGVPSISMSTRRGGTPTLAVLERAGRAYIGLDEYIDLVMKEGKVFA